MVLPNSDGPVLDIAIQDKVDILVDPPCASCKANKYNDKIKRDIAIAEGYASVYTTANRDAYIYKDRTQDRTFRFLKWALAAIIAAIPSLQAIGMGLSKVFGY